MLKTSITIVLAGAAIALPATASAAPRAFSLRYGTNQPGAVAIASNTLLSCPTTDAGCEAARSGQTSGAASNNNAYAMSYADVDGDASTFDSSRARLDVPAGARVLFAGLYYGADTSSGRRGRAALNAAALGSVKLRAPGDAAYRALTAGQLDTIGTRYQGFADVTAIVSTAGSGDYAVADAQSGTGEDRYAGWSLFVAYADDTQPARNISIFDGFQTVNAANQPRLDIPVTGFLTPATGPVRTDLGFAAYEGDRGSDGDNVVVQNTTLAAEKRAADNFFAGLIAHDGVPLTGTKDPDYDNNLGFDQGQFSVAGALPNGATSTTIHLATRAALGETYLPGVVSLTTDLYAPQVQPQLSVHDVGDGVLEYTVTLRNDGQDGARNVVLRDTIPAHTSFVAGSASVADSAGSAAFDATANGLRFDLGSVAPGETRTVRFRVTVDPAAPSGTVVSHQAKASFTAQTLGVPIDAQSAIVSTPLHEAPVAAPPPAAKPAADATPAPALAPTPASACEARSLRLVDVAAGARSVRLLGEAAPSDAGDAVSLSLAGHRIGAATVSADGTFEAHVALPPRALRATNDARYQAALGAMRSPAFKLGRRMRMTQLHSAGGTVTIAGRVSRPLAQPVRTVAIRQYADCTGASFRVVKRDVRVSASGRFRTTVPAPAGVGVAYYRAVTQVRKTTSNPKTYPTFTLLRRVVVGAR